MAKIRMNSLKYHQLVVSINNIRQNNKELINILSDFKYYHTIVFDGKIGKYLFHPDYEINNIHKILDNYYDISCKDKNSKFISETDFVEVAYDELIKMLNCIDDFENERIKTCKDIKTAKKFLIEFFNKNC